LGEWPGEGGYVREAGSEVNDLVDLGALPRFDRRLGLHESQSRPGYSYGPYAMETAFFVSTKLRATPKQGPPN
jgi:hypothetical protein